MNVAIKVNVKKGLRLLTDLEKRQLPFATAKALTDTAKDVVEAEVKEVDRVIDRPTRFTRKAFGMSRATKRNLVARVYIKDIQYKYLKYQIDGGTRLPDRRAVPVPVNARLNAHGNMTRGSIGRTMAKPNTFSGVPRGNDTANPGIYQRPRKTKRGKAKPLKMLVGWRPSATYSRRFNFVRVAKTTIKKTFYKNMRKNLAFALKTARSAAPGG